MKTAVDTPILFYDGTCSLCHFWVTFTLKRDKGGVFRFSPLQGETIHNVLSEEKVKSLPDSIVVINDNSVLIKSDAALFVLQALGGKWSFLAKILSWVPGFIRDFIYQLVARTRHKLFPTTKTACPLVPDTLKNRFLP